ncbi:MAG: hypothetical protein AAFP82_00545 [Bacteroidota bacterium]
MMARGFLNILSEAEFHLGTTAWNILVKASLKKEIQHFEVDFLINSQNSSGGWNMLPTSDENKTSTYATCMSILALNEIIKNNINHPNKAKTYQAIDKGIIWLVNSKEPLEPATWSDFPLDMGRKHASQGISSLVIYTLDETKNENENYQGIYKQYANNVLKDTRKKMDEIFSSNGFVVGQNGKSIDDRTRIFEVAWKLSAISKIFPSLSLQNKIRANIWINKVIIDNQLESIINEDWIISEILISFSILNKSIKD